MPLPRRPLTALTALRSLRRRTSTAPPTPGHRRQCQAQGPCAARRARLLGPAPSGLLIRPRYGVVGRRLVGDGRTVDGVAGSRQDLPELRRGQDISRSTAPSPPEQTDDDHHDREVEPGHLPATSDCSSAPSATRMSWPRVRTGETALPPPSTGVLPMSMPGIPGSSPARLARNTPAARMRATATAVAISHPRRSELRRTSSGSPAPVPSPRPVTQGPSVAPSPQHWHTLRQGVVIGQSRVVRGQRSVRRFGDLGRDYDMLSWTG